LVKRFANHSLCVYFRSTQHSNLFRIVAVHVDNARHIDMCEQFVHQWDILLVRVQPE